MERGRERERDPQNRIKANYVSMKELISKIHDKPSRFSQMEDRLVISKVGKRRGESLCGKKGTHTHTQTSYL